MAYSAAVKERFMHARFGGEAHALAHQQIVKVQVGDYTQGAVLELSLVLEQEHVYAARFKCYGCGACIALADAVCEKLEGLRFTEIKQLAVQSLATELQLPMVKMHCVWLVTEALNQLADNAKY